MDLVLRRRCEGRSRVARIPLSVLLGVGAVDLVSSAGPRAHPPPPPPLLPLPPCRRHRRRHRVGRRRDGRRRSSSSLAPPPSCTRCVLAPDATEIPAGYSGLSAHSDCSCRTRMTPCLDHASRRSGPRARNYATSAHEQCKASTTFVQGRTPYATFPAKNGRYRRRREAAALAGARSHTAAPPSAPLRNFGAIHPPRTPQFLPERTRGKTGPTKHLDARRAPDL